MKSIADCRAALQSRAAMAAAAAAAAECNAGGKGWRLAAAMSAGGKERIAGAWRQTPERRLAGVNVALAEMAMLIAVMAPERADRNGENANK